MPGNQQLTFRIFDGLTLYPHLQDPTEMKPVVVNPAITLEQLFEEFGRVINEKHRRPCMTRSS